MTDLEFSRPVRVEPLPRDGLELDIEANAAEREKLAKLNNLPGIERLTAHVRIRKWRRGVAVEGELSAKVTQTCVVSLEPFDVEVEEPIDVKFIPYAPDRPPPESTEDEDAPDPLIDGKIDLGAIASEFLTLALDPYPRKPGVAFDQPAAGDGPESPFARLRGLAARDEPD
jgi:uncharacterized metal-binding protein YceD (DUF177 family)